MELGPYAAEIGLTPESLESGTVTCPSKVKVGLVFEILKYAKKVNVSSQQSARWILSLFADLGGSKDDRERQKLLDYVRRSASRKYGKREKVRGKKRQDFLDSVFELPSKELGERENQHPSTEDSRTLTKIEVDTDLKTMAKVKGSYSLRRHNQSSLELMMECEEDELSPWQLEASRRALDDYEKAVQRIKAVKARQMIQQQKATAAPPTPPPSTRSSSPDVIIVGETPATRTQNQISRTSATQIKPQLHSSQIQSSSVPTSMITAINNPHTANVPGGSVQESQRRMVESSGVKALSQHQSQQQEVLPKAISSILANHQQQLQSEIAISQGQNEKIVAGTYGYGVKRADEGDVTFAIKRPSDTELISSPPKKKVQRKTSADSAAGNWVPLDEYYYGKMEGDPNYWEDKGEYRFKCWYCSKMLYNNVRTMMHMQGHIDSEKQQNLDLSDLTQCKHCYKQFDTPFEMQTHIEKVHMNNANVLLCRICEKDHDSRQALTNHMRQVHTACEMPYICQMCNFRSSMYSDAVDHFKKKHDSSQFILCLYCLKVFRVKFVANGWGQTQMYYHHLLKHQSKTNSRKCPICKLTFFNSIEVKTHRRKDHQSNQKGVIGMNAKYTTPDQVMIKVPEPGVAPCKDKGVKSLNAPALTKVMDYHSMKLPESMESLKCIECKTSMNTVGHFRKYIECSMCRFATSCSTAYATHMMGFHSGRLTNVSINIPTEKPMEEPMYCLCGFGSSFGNRIANHMVYCIKKTCYTQKPEVNWIEVDEVDEEPNYDDPRRRPGASILDVLGLVKKQTLLPGIYRRCGPASYPQSTLTVGSPLMKSIEAGSKSFTDDSKSPATPSDDDSPKPDQAITQGGDATKDESTPAESMSEEGDVDAEFTNWRKLCIEEFELEPENIEKLINRDIAEEWTPEEWNKLKKNCLSYGFWFAITDYIYSCEDYTFVKILPKIFENLFLDPPENISNFLSRIRRRLKRGGVDWIKETFLEHHSNIGPLCEKLSIDTDVLEGHKESTVSANQITKAVALELLYYKKRNPQYTYSNLAVWILNIFLLQTPPNPRDLRFQLEGIHRLKNKLRGHKVEVLKLLKEPFEPVESREIESSLLEDEDLEDSRANESPAMSDSVEDSINSVSTDKKDTRDLLSDEEFSRSSSLAEDQISTNKEDEEEEEDEEKQINNDDEEEEEEELSAFQGIKEADKVIKETEQKKKKQGNESVQLHEETGKSKSEGEITSVLSQPESCKVLSDSEKPVIKRLHSEREDESDQKLQRNDSSPSFSDERKKTSDIDNKDLEETDVLASPSEKRLKLDVDQSEDNDSSMKSKESVVVSTTEKKVNQKDEISFDIAQKKDNLTLSPTEKDKPLFTLSTKSVDEKPKTTGQREDLTNQKVKEDDPKVKLLEEQANKESDSKDIETSKSLEKIESVEENQTKFDVSTGKAKSRGKFARKAKSGLEEPAKTDNLGREKNTVKAKSFKKPDGKSSSGGEEEPAEKANSGDEEESTPKANIEGEEQPAGKASPVEEEATEKASSKKEEKPTRKATSKKEEKPSQKAISKKDEEPTEKVNAKKEEKPTQKASSKKEEETTEKVNAKKEEKPTQKASSKKEEKQTQKASSKKEEEPTEKASSKEEEEPIEKASSKKEEESAEKSNSKKEERPAEKASSKKEVEPAEKTNSKKEEEPTVKASSKNEQKPEKISFKMEQKLTEKASSKKEDEPTEKASSKKEGEPTEKADSKKGDEPTEKASSKKGVEPTEIADSKKEGEPTEKASSKKEGEPTEKASSKKEGEPTEKASSKKEGEPTEKASSKKECEPTEKASSKKEGEPTEKASSKKEGEPTEKASSKKEGEPTEKASSKKEGEPTEKASSKKEGEPTEKASSKKEGESTEKASSKMEGEPTEKASSKNEQKPEKISPKMEQKLTEKASSKMEQKLTEKASSKKEEVATEKVISKKEREPTEKAVSKKEREPTEKAVSKKEREPTEKAVSKKEREPTEKAVSKKEREPTEKASYKKEDEPTEKAVSKKEREPTEKAGSKKEDEPTEKAASKKEDEPTEKASSKKEDEPTEKASSKKEDELTEKAGSKMESESMEKTRSKKVDEPTTEKASSKKEGVATEKASSKKEQLASEKASSKKEGVATEKASSKKEGVATEKASSKKEELATVKASSKKEELATEKSSSKKDELATEKSSSKKDELATEKSSSKKDELATEKSSSKKDELATEKASSKKDELATEKASSKKDELATEKASSKKDELATEKASSKKDELATEKASSKKDELATEKASSKKDELATEKASSKKDELATEKASSKKDVTSTEKASSKKDVTSTEKASSKKDVTSTEKASSKKDVTSTEKASSKKDVTSTDKASSKKKDESMKKTTSVKEDEPTTEKASFKKDVATEKASFKKDVATEKASFKKDVATEKASFKKDVATEKASFKKEEEAAEKASSSKEKTVEKDEKNDDTEEKNISEMNKYVEPSSPKCLKEKSVDKTKLEKQKSRLTEGKAEPVEEKLKLIEKPPSGEKTKSLEDKISEEKTSSVESKHKDSKSNTFEKNLDQDDQSGDKHKPTAEEKPKEGSKENDFVDEKLKSISSITTQVFESEEEKRKLSSLSSIEEKPKSVLINLTEQKAKSSVASCEEVKSKTSYIGEQQEAAVSSSTDSKTKPSTGTKEEKPKQSFKSSAESSKMSCGSNSAEQKTSSPEPKSNLSPEKVKQSVSLFQEKANQSLEEKNNPDQTKSTVIKPTEVKVTEDTSKSLVKVSEKKSVIKMTDDKPLSGMKTQVEPTKSEPKIKSQGSGDKEIKDTKTDSQSVSVSAKSDPVEKDNKVTVIKMTSSVVCPTSTANAAPKMESSVALLDKPVSATSSVKSESISSSKLSSSKDDKTKSESIKETKTGSSTMGSGGDGQTSVITPTKMVDDPLSSESAAKKLESSQKPVLPSPSSSSEKAESHLSSASEKDHRQEESPRHNERSSSSLHPKGADKSKDYSSARDMFRERNQSHRDRSHDRDYRNPSDRPYHSRDDYAERHKYGNGGYDNRNQPPQRGQYSSSDFRGPGGTAGHFGGSGRDFRGNHNKYDNRNRGGGHPGRGFDNNWHGGRGGRGGYGGSYRGGYRGNYY